jgi:hypothetical protein
MPTSRWPRISSHSTQRDPLPISYAGSAKVFLLNLTPLVSVRCTKIAVHGMFPYYLSYHPGSFLSNARIFDPLPNSPSFVDTLIEELYRPPPSQALDLHRLGLFYMILAIATQHDQSKPIYNDESYRYCSLGRACLSSKGVLENPSIPALQALVSTLSSCCRPGSVIDLRVAYYGPVSLVRK